MKFLTLAILALAPLILGADFEVPEQIPISTANKLAAQDATTLQKATEKIFVKNPAPLQPISPDADALRTSFANYNKLSYCPLHPTATESNPTWTSVAHIEKENPLGYHVVAVDDVRKTIAIVFRGSMNLQVRANLFMFNLVNAAPFQKSWRQLVSSNNQLATTNGFQVTVHQGCWEGYLSVRDALLKRVEGLLKEKPGYTIGVTGYSYGGPLAVYAATDMRLAFPKSNTNLVTFGGPRPGGQTFSALISNLFKNDGRENVYLRVTTFRDAYPLMPPPNFGYVHAGREAFKDEQGNIVFCATADTGAEDPRCGLRILAENSVVRGDGMASEKVHHTYWEYMTCGPGEAYEEGEMIKVDPRAKTKLESIVFGKFLQVLQLSKASKTATEKGKTAKGNNEV